MPRQFAEANFEWVKGTLQSSELVFLLDGNFLDRPFRAFTDTRAIALARPNARLECFVRAIDRSLSLCISGVKCV